MRIVSFQAENFKGIKLVDITPEGDVVLVTGATGQGKTSVLDAVWAALGGGDASRTVTNPIRKGEKYASVRLDLGEYVVLRSWFGTSTKLVVTSPRGAEYGSPQKLLDGLIGKIAMNPLSFIRQKPAEQVTTLLDVLGDSLGFDPADIERRRAEAFADRAGWNRDVKELTAQLAGTPDVAPETPDAIQSVSDIGAEFAAAQRHNQQIVNTKQDFDSLSVELVQAEQAIADAIAFRDRVQGEHVDMAKALDALGQPIDTTEIEDRMAAVDEINAAVRAKLQRNGIAERLQAVKDEAAAAEKRLTDIAQEKVDGLANAKLPLEGLAFDESGVTYNGIALSDVSGREKRVVSFALAMALNPDLRVVRIDEGESLGSDGLAHIAQMAAENDFQVWISKVDESGEIGVVIEDGMVKA